MSAPLIHISFAKIYKFKGWLFEHHRYLGGWPLTKDLEPRKRAGDKFWLVYSEFYSLNSKDKENYRVKL